MGTRHPFGPGPGRARDSDLRAGTPTSLPLWSLTGGERALRTNITNQLAQ